MNKRFGLYEPIHGSAPDLAGTGKANPVGMILSVAMMLRHSLGQEAAALAIEEAVEAALESGQLTQDLAPYAQGLVTTEEFGDLVVDHLMAL